MTGKGLLTWLIDTGDGVPPPVRAALLDKLSKSPAVVVMGSVNALLTLAACLGLAFSPVFVALAVVEVVLLCIRIAVMLWAARVEEPRMEWPATLSILWCALEGGTSVAMMTAGNQTLQTLSGVMIMGVIGPICVRNYGTPRLAFLLVCLCDLPFVGGACSQGRTWLLIMVPMTPPFLYAVWQIVGNLNRMAVTALNAELQSGERARRDVLTGALNRLALSEALPRALAELDGSLALLCLDLDGFKTVNDTLGHQAGDSLLHAVTGRIAIALRPQDPVFRIGGDEFVVLVAGLPPPLVSALADRIIESVTGKAYHLPGEPDVRIGISVGFACAPEDGLEADELYRKADAALYTSKAAGKGVQRRFEVVASAA